MFPGQAHGVHIINLLTQVSTVLSTNGFSNQNPVLAEIHNSGGLERALEILQLKCRLSRIPCASKSTGTKNKMDKF
jgi:hypothetical protein